MREAQKFIKWFQDYLALLDYYDNEIVAHALRNALISDGPMYINMVKHKIASMEKALVQAEKYIRPEDDKSISCRQT